MIAWLRCLLFNLVFYGVTAVLCVAFLPTFLLPWPVFWRMMRGYFKSVHLMEKYILGLDFVLTGTEYLPQHGRYIVAAKHHSAYETMLLPVIFEKPVVIVKRELLWLPGWGWYAARAGMIGINRGNARTARQQMIEGTRAALNNNRPLIVFPQGTRVGIHQTATERPYKRGIADLYAELNVPVIPLALNSGVFWPRNALLKKPGVVTLAFLPPINPGLDKHTFMAHLEGTLENQSNKLVAQALSPPAATS